MNSACIIVLALYINTLQPSAAIDNLDPVKKQKIDDFIIALKECDGPLPGMNLAIVHDGETLYTTGYGVRNRDLPDPVTENTIFTIASVTKHFTTALLGKIIEDTGYSWDSKVHDILADFGTEFYFNDPLRSNMTTLQDLAAHLTGLDSHPFLWMQQMTRAEQASRVRFMEPDYEMRTSFIYNNVLYTLLGHITEEIVGVSWEELIQTEFFDKLGMSNSSMVYYVDETEAEVSGAYYLDQDTGDIREIEWQAISETGPDWAPAAGISSTANDMAQWMKMLLSGGRNEDGEQIVPDFTIYEMTDPVNAFPYSSRFNPPHDPVDFSTSLSYGLGLYQGSYRGYRLQYHSGASYGQYTYYQLYPDVELGIYMSVNAEYYNTAWYAMYIFDIVLDIEPWFNITDLCPETKVTLQKPDIDLWKMENVAWRIPPESRIKKPIARNMVDSFLGNYGNFLYGNVSVIPDDFTEKIYMQFDVYSCTLNEVTSPDHYNCFGSDLYWFHDLDGVKFDVENNPAQYVDIILVFDYEYTRFYRDLSQDEAPGPHDHWPTCE